MGIFFGKKKKRDENENIIVIRKSVHIAPKLNHRNESSDSSRGQDVTIINPAWINSKKVEETQKVELIGGNRINPDTSVIPQYELRRATKSLDSEVPKDVKKVWERVVNLYGIANSVFKICQNTVLVIEHWQTDINGIQLLLSNNTADLEMRFIGIRNSAYLTDWIQPFQFGDHEEISQLAKTLVNSYDVFYEDFDLSSKKRGRDSFLFEFSPIKQHLQKVVSSYLNFVLSTESVASLDFSEELEELVKTMKSTLNTAMGKTDLFFDDIARISMTCSIRFQKLVLWKAIQQNNPIWSTKANQFASTLVKAMKIIHELGGALFKNPTDQAAKKNLLNIAMGVSSQIKSFKELNENNEKNESKEQIVEQEDFTKVYTKGIMDITKALNHYKSNREEDKTLSKYIDDILVQINLIKTFSNNVEQFNVAVSSLGSCLEKFCASVYFLLLELREDDQVIKEQVMENMQHSLHCCIQIFIVASCQSLHFPVINLVESLLSAFRALLNSVVMIIEAVDWIKGHGLLQEDYPENQILLEENDINEAILCIMHYGRALFKGEEKYFRESHKVSIQPKLFKQVPSLDNPLETPKRQTTPPRSPSVFQPQVNYQPKISQVLLPPISNERGQVPVKHTSVYIQNRVNTLDEEWLLTVDPDKYNSKHLPPGFESPPAVLPLPDNYTDAQLSDFMASSFAYETWENKLLLYKVNLKKEIENAKKKRALVLCQPMYQPN
eukprot:TRINITY_DN1917_c0_g1_i1.p1 TRINITY_DN1917_c0_g1~~TRINITY_DN1917_c0_g1_i1.p1  ORF type:complete len:724 (-),score=144.71 TRINITY_DN1917_c0_g1_i1:81-2252(-)